MLGPNGLGFASPHEDVNLMVGGEFPPGNVAVISQSGNYGAALSIEANAYADIGFSHFISIGNEADIKFHELIEYFDDDDRTDAVVIYVEGMSDGRAFLQSAATVVEGLPIVVSKAVSPKRASRQPAHTQPLLRDLRRSSMACTIKQV